MVVVEDMACVPLCVVLGVAVPKPLAMDKQTSAIPNSVVFFLSTSQSKGVERKVWRGQTIKLYEDSTFLSSWPTSIKFEVKISY